MRSYIPFFILLLSSPATLAQSGRHRLDVGYGIETLDHMRKDPFISWKGGLRRPTRSPLAEEAGPLFGLALSDMSMGAGDRTGTLVLSYRYGLLKWLSAGIALSYEQETQTVYVKERSSGIQSPIGDFKRNVYTVAAELQPVYKRRPWVTFYALVGAGNGFITEKATNDLTSTSVFSSVNETSFQLTPFAIRVGKQLSGHMEIGYGYKGIIHVGVGYEL